MNKSNSKNNKKTKCNNRKTKKKHNNSRWKRVKTNYCLNNRDHNIRRKTQKLKQEFKS